MRLHSSFVQDSPKLENTQVSLSEWLVQQSVYSGTLGFHSEIKRYKPLINITWMDIQQVMLWDKVNSTGYILWGPDYRTLFR